ncbi:hypothetical protein QBC38DRAFT_468502 [Podospora fimiseda]|uniref:t-SNARE coiled-coil homology domain-containing protein n=1 Tax=Podospora fimiseda TaxID=252190 RepID=A0AAN7BW26_9PEZI|nr:hypothetical protein QBC38DRAFT_468502 [Podospora fimiseda]
MGEATSAPSSPSFEDGEARTRETNIDPDFIKETFLSPSSLSSSDYEDDKSEFLLEKEADMAVYNSHHHSRMQRPPPLTTLQTVQSLEDVTLNSDGVQQVQRLVAQPQQAQPPAKSVEKARKRKGLKAFFTCCFKPDLSEDEDEDEEPKEPEYKMETFAYYPREEPAMGRLGSLFRKSDEKKSSGDANDNPYAQQSPADSYSPNAPSTSSFQSYNNNQYSQNQTGLPSGPRPGGYGRNEPTSVPPPYNAGGSPYVGSGKSPSVGYGNDRFGAQGGYGSHRYDNDAASLQSNALPSQRPGGYGGLSSGSDSNPLFSGYSPQPNRDYSSGFEQQQLDEPRDEFGNRREMTEQEREDYEVAKTKREINQIRGATEDTLDRVLAKIDLGNQQADQAMQTLENQGDTLYRANKSIGEATVQARIGKANVKDLEDANKSMFNFYAMSRRRRDHLDDERMLAEYEEKDMRQQLHDEERLGKAQRAKRTMDGAPMTLGASGRADHSKFIFEESDGEQEEAEKRMAIKEEQALRGVQAIHHKMEAFSDEIDSQNQLISKIAARTDKVHDNVIYSQNRINRFK